MASTAALSTTYTFSGAVGDSSYPTCNGGTWSGYTCSGSISLASGDSILPSSNITVVASAGITLAGSNTIGSAAVTVNLQTGWNPIQVNGSSSIYGTLTSNSGAINLTNTIVQGGVATSGAVSLSGGNVSGSVTGNNGVTTASGTVIGGSVLANTGSVSLSGGSVGGSVHSDCCIVTTNNTNVGNGVSSNSNTVTIDGGTVSGAISTGGGSGVVIKNATISSGSSITVTAVNVAITISNSTVNGNVSGNNFVHLLDHTTVWGTVKAGDPIGNPGWTAALDIDGTSQVAGNCTPTNPRCNASIPPNHVLLTHTGSGITCMGATVTVTACSGPDSNGSCSPNTSGLSGNVVAMNGGTVVSTVPFAIAATSSSTTVIIKVPTVQPTDQVVTFQTSGLSSTPTAPPGYTCWNSSDKTTSCSYTFHNAGFIVSNASDGLEQSISTQTAGAASLTYYLRAVKTNPVTKACEAALTGATAVDLAYQCNDPATCYTSNAPTCGSSSGYFCLTPYNGATPQAAQALAANPNTGVSSYTSSNLVFDSNGSAPFLVNFMDVGRIKLYARKLAGGTLAADLTGTSNSFVTKPYAFAISGVNCSTVDAANCGGGALSLVPAGNNPGAADASGASFIRAGDPFTVTVTAQRVGNVATPSFGRETVPESVKLSPVLTNGLGLTNQPAIDGATTTGSVASGNTSLTVASTTGCTNGGTILVKGAGVLNADLWTTATAVSGSTVTLATPASTTVTNAVVNCTFGPFSAGSATGSKFTWGEVGIITLLPSVADGDYLGAGNVSGTVSGNVGRFYPHHFGFSGSVATRSDLHARTTGTAAAGSSSLTVASATGIVAGNPIIVLGAGPDGVPLQTIVAAVGANVVLATPATTAVTNTPVYSFKAPADFTYMGEPIKLLLTVNAYNAMDGTTLNYAGGFAKIDAATLSANANWFNTGCAANTQCMGLGAVDAATTGLSGSMGVNTSVANPVSSWTNGVGAFTLDIAFGRGVPNGPFDSLLIGGIPQDSDGVTLPGPTSSDPHKVNLDAATGNTLSSNPDGILERRSIATPTKVRFGKLVIDNASGSERQNLPVKITALYYAGSPTGWAVNTADSNTALPVAAFTAFGTNSATEACYTAACTSNVGGGVGSVWLHDLGGTQIAGAAAPIASSATLIAGTPPSPGTGTVTLATPGTPGTLEFTLVVPSWLKSNSGRNGTGSNYNWNPMGRITFGVYGPATNKSRVIYTRENY